jgi:hypothetical protein
VYRTLDLPVCSLKWWINTFTFYHLSSILWKFNAINFFLQKFKALWHRSEQQNHYQEASTWWKQNSKVNKALACKWMSVGLIISFSLCHLHFILNVCVRDAKKRRVRDISRLYVLKTSFLWTVKKQSRRDIIWHSKRLQVEVSGLWRCVIYGWKLDSIGIKKKWRCIHNDQGDQNQGERLSEPNWVWKKGAQIHEIKIKVRD